MKITKGLGLGYTDGKRQLLAVDDPGLDPVFEMAGKLGMPIAIHTGDPKAFWKPPTPDNERFDELRVHPGWSFFGAPVTWEGLYAQFERRVARHPKTTFIGVHFGNDPEDPGARRGDARPPQEPVIDTAARLPEIGRVDANHDAGRMRAFFEKYRTRILFGTDVGVGNADEDLMLGSTGATPARAGRRRALLHVDVALVRDQRQADPVADADSGPLEHRRRRAPARGPRGRVPRQRGAAARREAAGGRRAVIALDTTREENIITRR